MVEKCIALRRTLVVNSILIKFEAYLLSEKRVSVNTFQAYMQDVKQFVAFLTTKNMQLLQAQEEDLKKFLAFLKEQHCTARSMARKISSLRVFFSWAHNTVQWQNITKNIVSPKLEKRLPQFLSEKEVEELFASAQLDTSDLGKRNAVMLFLLYVAGLRISELTHLTVTHLDLDSSTIIIEGKGGKGRVVPIPAHVVVMVREYLDTVHKKFIVYHGKTDYLFPVMYGKAIKPISRQSFWGILKDLCVKTTIKRSVSPHQLRHSLATHLLKNGADLRSLQLLLGHENISTVQIYTHLDTGHLRKEYDKKHPRS